MKNRLKAILFIASVGLLMGLMTAHLINFGFFAQWHMIILPPNMLAKHLAVNQEPLMLQIDTFTQETLWLEPDPDNYQSFVRQTPPNRKIFGHCQQESLLDNYYVTAPPGRVIEQWDCRFLAAGDWPIIYRFIILEGGQIWQWTASHDVEKIIVYGFFGFLGLFFAPVLFLVYVWFQSDNKK